jgi:hypothetical protein
MANMPPDPNAQPNTGAEARLRPDRQSMPGVPRWVKVAAAIAVVLVVGFVIIHLAGGGFMGHAPVRPY